MFRVLSSLVFTLVICASAHAQDAKPLFPEPETCATPLNDGDIGADERGSWSDCEKWVWSCIVKGEEANLFAKRPDASTTDGCRKARSKEASELRTRLRLAAFKDPGRFETANAISDKFLLTILTNPAYASRIPPSGVRIFGAYFKDPINLENLTTTVNIVLDASMMKRGLRLTNFKSEKNLSLDYSNVRGSIYMMRARIEGSLFMEKGVFDSVDLNDARIGASLEATGSVFNDELRIHRAFVQGKVILQKARLTALSGWNTRMGSSLEMRLADIRLGVDLTGSSIDGDVRMQDVTFGRHASGTSVRCDWDPASASNHVLNELKSSLNENDFEAAIKETVTERPSKADGVQPNSCEAAEKNASLADKTNALLRDMKIKGALCLVDVTGEIAIANDGQSKKHIGKISLDGTDANSTILSWKPSQSQTLWYMVNFKTNYLLINLQSQPRVHYTDNINVGAITLLKGGDAAAGETKKTDGRSEEYLVKEKCDVTPGPNTTHAADDRDTQDRIIGFFKSDQAAGAQPFANIVARIEDMGVNTTHLKIALSEHKNRNACASSQLMRKWNELPWTGVGERLKTLTIDETRKFALDGVCLAGLAGLKYSVSYGHEPHNLIFWAILLVFLFAAALRLDRRNPNIINPGPPLGLTYAIDTLNPLKPYRIDRLRAEERPNSRWLRVYLAVHRVLGVVLAVLAFFFIYKASQ